jgi:hypothetical protein
LLHFDDVSSIKTLALLYYTVRHRSSAVPVSKGSYLPLKRKSNDVINASSVLKRKQCSSHLVPWRPVLYLARYVYNGYCSVISNGISHNRNCDQNGNSVLTEHVQLFIMTEVNRTASGTGVPENKQSINLQTICEGRMVHVCRVVTKSVSMLVRSYLYALLRSPHTF